MNQDFVRIVSFSTFVAAELEFLRNNPEERKIIFIQ
jgi:hypothetical protein